MLLSDFFPLKVIVFCYQNYSNLRLEKYSSTTRLFPSTKNYVIQIGKNNWDLETCWKVRKNKFMKIPSC